MSKSKAYIKLQIYSPLISDTLPYEVPMKFSNRLLFEKLQSLYDKYIKEELKKKSRGNETEIMSGLNFFIEKYIPRDMLNHIKYIKKNKKDYMICIPYLFKINKDTQNKRKISLIHPLSQIHVCDFYQKYEQLILYYCNLSNYSLRHPYKKTNYVHNKYSKIVNKITMSESSKDVQTKDLQEEIDQLTQDNQKILNDIRVAQERYKKQLEELANKNNNSEGSSSSGSSSSGGSSTSGTSNPGGFIRPVNGGTVTCNGRYSSGKFHGAIDYGVNVGTPVYAAADGVVLTTNNLTTSYGTYVVIQHANGLQTWYAHGTPGSICVSPGQSVSQGQMIMKSGNSGNSSGAHLHFEVRKAPYTYSYSAKNYGDDCRVDPNLYF